MCLRTGWCCVDYAVVGLALSEAVNEQISVERCTGECWYLQGMSNVDNYHLQDMDISSSTIY